MFTMAQHLMQNHAVKKYIVYLISLIIMGITLSVGSMPSSAAETAPTDLSARRASSSSVELRWSHNSIQNNLETRLAWFYLPHDSRSQMINNFDVFVLSKNFESDRNAIENAGKNPVLQYIRFDSIHDPCYQARGAAQANCSCSTRPLNNSVGWNAGDVCWIRDNHPDWFLKDRNGNVIYSGFNGGDPFVIMDPGKQGWREFFLNRITQTQNNGWDGILLDNLGEIFTAHTGQRVALRDYPTDRSYQDAVVGFLRYIQQNYFASRSNKPVYANFSALWDRGDAYYRIVSELDGVMDEYWGVTKTSYYPELSFERRLDGAYRTQQMGKPMVLVSQGNRTDHQRQQFAFATYLLVATEISSFRYTQATSGGYDEVWLYDNYDIQLGQPKGKYYQTGGDRYYRDFDYGQVWVNPVTRASQITYNTLKFDIYRSSNGGSSFNFLASVDGDVSRYVDNNASGDYCYRVRFVNGGNRSGYSNIGCSDGTSSGGTGGSGDNPNTGSGPQITGFELLNGNTRQTIDSSLNNGEQINVSELPGRINIEANGNNIGSIRFTLSGALSRTHTENLPPYVLFSGDGQQLGEGNYTLSATAYSGSNGGGTRGNTLTINFTVDQQSSGANTGGSNLTLTLLNGSTRQPISGFNPIQNGAELNLSQLPANFDIRANVGGLNVGSVDFSMSGRQSRSQMENYAPYEFFGGGSRTFATGSYTLSAEVYTGLSGGGNRIATTTINFTVVNASSGGGNDSGGSNDIGGSNDSDITVGDVTLVNANTNQDIMTLSDGMQIDLANLPTRNLNIRARTNSSEVKSIYFAMSGRQSSTRTENVAPYAFKGDNSGNYIAWTPPTGAYTLRITPYDGSNRSGEQGNTQTINFTIVNSNNRDDVVVIEPDTVPGVVNLITQVNFETGVVQPTFAWNLPTDAYGVSVPAEWYNVLVVNQAGDVVLDEWTEFATACAETPCTFSPEDNSLINGDYVWWVRSWVNEAYADLSDEGVFTVEVTAPAPPHFTIDANQGNPIVSWNDDPNSNWVQVYVGDANGTQFLEWVEETAALCDGVTCTLPLALNLPLGDYEVYMQAWGAGGMSRGGIEGWAGPVAFTLAGAPPALPANLHVTYSANGFAQLNWDYTADATWYEVWLGTVDDQGNRQLVHTDWYPVEGLGCDDDGLCTLNVTMILEDSAHVYYVRAYGPSGYSVDGIEGWAEGAAFTP